MGRMVLATVITMLLVETFKLPFGFLAIFYALAIARENPHATVRNGFRIILANFAGAAFVILGAMFMIDYPLTHFLLVAISFFVVFFITRTSRNFSVAFGFGIMVVAGVCLIWQRPSPAELRLETTIGASFGIALGTVVTIVIEWLLAGKDHPRPAPARLAPAHPAIFVADAFSNPEYLVYALKGALAGSLCFAIWTSLFWPGVGESIITCVIVAPTGLPGSPRRQMFTRVMGVLVGGLFFGIGSQVWLNPLLDSVFGFTLAFAIVTAIAAWCATAGPRLAYFGRQLALAYDVAMFQGFSARTPLAAGWNPQMGIFLGLIVMWMVFDLPGTLRRSRTYKTA
jgi:uncharacterized membrane protein YccC